MRTSRPYPDLAPAAYEGFLQVVRHLHGCGLEPALLHLVELRASQLNGCTFCMDMHATAALGRGESQRRLNALAGWREAPFFSSRERAALAWTEALTHLAGHPVSEAQYQAVRQEFSEQDCVNLSFAVALINAWNRLGAAFAPDLPAEA